MDYVPNVSQSACFKGGVPMIELEPVPEKGYRLAPVSFMYVPYKIFF